MKRVYKEGNEMDLAYGVVEPLQFLSKIFTKTAKAPQPHKLGPFRYPLYMPSSLPCGIDIVAFLKHYCIVDFF